MTGKFVNISHHKEAMFDSMISHSRSSYQVYLVKKTGLYKFTRGFWLQGGHTIDVFNIYISNRLGIASFVFKIHTLSRFICLCNHIKVFANCRLSLDGLWPQ